MVICNGDYVVQTWGTDRKGKYSIHRPGVLYRVVVSELHAGASRVLAIPVDMKTADSARYGYNPEPTELFERVFVRPHGVPKNWEIVRVGMPAEWEYYQDPVDGLIYQSVTGAMPPYAAVNVVRSTGPQERGMPSHNPKYADRKDCQGVSPSETSGKEDLMMDVVGQGVVRRSQPVRTADMPHLKSGPHPVQQESTAAEVEAWAAKVEARADQQEVYDVWSERLWDQIKQLPTMPLPDGACYVPKTDEGHRQMEFNRYLVNDDIDESSGCWRMVVATPEWLAAANFKHHVLVGTVGTYSVPCSVS